MKIAHGGIANLVEVVRQYLGRQTHRNALNTLRQKQREFHRERYGFFVSPVVWEFPFCGFGIEHHVKGKFRKPCLNITRSCRRVIGKNVSPVSLSVYKQIFLPQLNKSIVYRSIAVRMEFHCLAHNIRHLVISSVVHAFHGVQYAPLHRFQSVVEMRHCAFQNHIACIIQKPILIHSRQTPYYSAVAGDFGNVLRMKFFFVVFVRHINRMFLFCCELLQS